VYTQIYGTSLAIWDHSVTCHPTTVVCAVIGCKLKQNANEGCNSCASLAGLVSSVIACFILLVIAPLGCVGGEIIHSVWSSLFQRMDWSKATQDNSTSSPTNTSLHFSDNASAHNVNMIIQSNLGVRLLQHLGL